MFYAGVTFVKKEEGETEGKANGRMSFTFYGNTSNTIISSANKITIYFEEVLPIIFSIFLLCGW